MMIPKIIQRLAAGVCIHWDYLGMTEGNTGNSSGKGNGAGNGNSDLMGSANGCSRIVLFWQPGSSKTCEVPKTVMSKE